MAYRSHFVRTNTPVPTSSRSGPGVYGGLACPDRISFSLVHGTTPANGEVDFEGDAFNQVKAGSEAYLIIGQNTFYGIVIKQERSVRVDSGYTVKFVLADNRDRLFDDLVFGQFNMFTGDGEMFHIFPKDWETQTQTIIRAEDKTDFKRLVRDPAQVRRINIDIGGCTRPVSSAELLDWLAGYYNFAWGATPIALSFLKAAKPVNMDWNQGTPVGQAIQDILNYSELQFTVWGNLYIFITVAGYTENPIQWEILKSDKALCELGAGFSQTNLGQELNTKGRRLILVGGENKYQFIYPGVPGWNTNWTWNLCFNYELAILLEAVHLTSAHKLKDMPKEFHDYGIWHGSSRMEMTIQDYINQIPFRVYVINFGIILDENFKVPHLDPQERDARFEKLPNGNLKMLPVNQRGTFNWQLNGNDPRINHVNPELFSRDPVSDTLITHSGNLVFNDDPDHTLTSRQFIAWANSRAVMKKDQIDPWDMVNQAVRVDDGVNLEIEEIIHKKLCQKLYKVNAVFSSPRIILNKREQIEIRRAAGIATPGSPQSYQPVRAKGALEGTPSAYRDWTFTIESNKKDDFPYDITHDKPYFAICTDREIFRREFGEASRRGQPVRYRQREKAIHVNSLRRGYVNGSQVFMLMANMNTRVDELGRLVKDINGNPIQAFSAYTADEIAPAMAYDILRHEAVTSAGNITIEDAAGFKPDGLITSVADEWTDGIGFQETINFTNDQNHEFHQVVLDIRTIQRGAPDNEAETNRRELIRRSKDILKFPQPQRAKPIPDQNGLGDNFEYSPLHRLKAPGDKNMVLASVAYDAALPNFNSAEMVVLESTA